jgi:hypothetical protein
MAEDTILAGMVAPEAPVADVPPDKMRERAISQVLAAVTDRQDETVAQFRRDHLNGDTIAPGEVRDWVRRTAASDGAASSFIANVPWEAFQYNKQDGSYTLPKDWANALRFNKPIVPRRDGGVDISTLGRIESDPCLISQDLQYVAPASDDNLRQEPIGEPVRAGGVLYELRRLAFYLLGAHEYWADDPRQPYEYRRLWGEARAATFVLTGYAPLVAEELFPLPSYRGMHRQSAKHLQLAVFTERRAGEPLATRMDEWNRRFPAWGYLRTTNFGWDSSQAVKRLMQHVEE